MTAPWLPDQEPPRYSAEQEIDLGTLFRGLRRYLPAVLVLSALVGLAVYLWSRAQPPVYEASASIITSSSQSQIGVVGGPVVSPLPVDTVAQVMRSPLILQPLIRAVRDDRAIAPAERQRLVRGLTRELLNPSERAQGSIITVRAEQGSGENSVYTVRARAQTPGAAQILAGLASRQLLAWDAERTLQDVRLARQNFGLQLAQIDRRLTLPGLTPQERLTLTYRRATMQDNLAQLSFLESARAGVLRPLVGAVRPLRPVTPSPLRNALLGGMLTLFLGLGVAALRTVLHRTVRGEEDLLALHLPVLGALPRLRPADLGAGRVLPAGRNRSLDEALGFLRVNLHTALQNRAHPILMLTGTAAYEGISTLTATLAERLATSGQRVLLIDADLRRGTQQLLWNWGAGDHPWCQLSGTGGIRTFQDALRQPDHVQVMQVSPNLHLLPAGSGAQDSLTLLGRPDLEALLRRWSQAYDLVLIDSPPLLVVADALMVGKQADAVLLVTEEGKTGLPAVRQVLRWAQGAGLVVVGAVINKVNAPRQAVRLPGVGSGDARWSRGLG